MRRSPSLLSFVCFIEKIIIMPELSKILFLDIETAPLTATWSDMDPKLAHFWNEKVTLLRQRIPERYPEESTGESKFQEAGLFAEFGFLV